MSLRRLFVPLLFTLFLLFLRPLHARAAGVVKWSDASAALDLGSASGVTEVTVGGKESPIVYCIVDGVGLFSSTDLGKSWTPLKGDTAPLAHPYAITAAPDNSNTLYAAPSTDGQGLWLSTDAGKTFSQLATSKEGLASDDVEWITISPANPKFILVGHRAGIRISVSQDGGKTFTGSTFSEKDELKNQLPFIIDESHWLLATRAGPQDQTHRQIYYTEDAGKTWAAAQGDVDYFGGHLPLIQAGSTFISTKHHGPSISSDGGKSYKYHMEPAHTRVIGSVGDIMLREGDRTMIRGTTDRIINLELSDNFGQSWTGTNSNLLQVVPQKLRTALIIPQPTDPYAHIRLATAFAAAPDQRNIFLGLGKAGLYRGQLLWTKDGPRLAAATLNPVSLPEGDVQTPIVVTAAASARRGNLKRVYADLSAVGGTELELFDDGNHGDGQPNDKVFGNKFTVKGNPANGPQVIGIVAEDDKGNISSTAATLEIAALGDAVTIWDGEKFAGGQSWIAPPGPFNTFKAQAEDAHSGKIALELHGEGSGYIGGGWNWHGWYPADSGDDIRKFRNLTFWVKYDHQNGDNTADPTLSLISANGGGTGTVSVSSYVPDLKDGKWHECTIPLLDIYNAKAEKPEPAFDPSHVWMMNISTWSGATRSFSLFVDDIGLNNAKVRPHSVWVTTPDSRAPTPIPADAPAVTASITTKADGTAISPYIYGAAMADHKLAKEIGLTILRAGGNPITAVNWKTGFGSQGSDWFYENQGKETDPQNNWVVNFYGGCKDGMEAYVSMPIMGRVAKDGTSCAFDIAKYKDQTNWAGKAQPTDRMPNAGNGIAYTRDAGGEILKDAKGNPLTHEVEPDPNDSSIEMSPQDQTDMLKFMIDKLNYGTADKGGLKFMALDNEPGLWSTTHRGMHPAGFSYDELWDRTKTYAALVEKIDPAIKIAGPTAWGWTEYFFSGKDSQDISRSNGKLTWDHPPDFEAHGSVPLSKWYMKQLKAYKDQTGVSLVDILDWHFYPQNGLYQSGAKNDPKTMETRVQETRVLWDPAFLDNSWMGKEAIPPKNIRLLRMMKEWIAENNPGMGTALGEYNFGGEDELSGGVAQAELLGVFAREQLGYAFYWFAPAPNSSTYFAFKMFRNPDGNHTAFGDRYLPVTTSAPDDVSVHAAKDSKTGRLTFVLVNKRAAKPAKVTLTLDAPIKEQPLTRYEYSAADTYTIGQLPETKVSGTTITLDLPAMSIQRFDLIP